MIAPLGTKDAPAGLYDLPAMAGNNDPRANAGFVDVKLTRKSASSLYGVSTDGPASLAMWVRLNCDEVKTEIACLQRAKIDDATDYGRRIIIMAILSAQVDFAENLYVTKEIMRNWESICRVETAKPGMIDADIMAQYLESPYRGYGKMRKINGWRQKSQYLARAIPFLCNFTPDQMTLENLNRLAGVGPKIAAFTMALWDETAPVFTLDVWMLRLSASIVGRNPRIRVSMSAEAYALLEGDWLAWCHRWLPDMAPFVVQWTLWNGCFGYHRSHLDILG